MKNYQLFIVLITNLASLVNGEVFTAVADMEPLLHTQRMVIFNIEKFIQKHEEKLKMIENYIEEYQVKHSPALKDPSGYFTNPLNGFLIIKRLTKDWNKMREKIVTNIGNEILRNITEHKKTMLLPTKEDLTGAAEAMVRLQDLYQLNVSNLVKGEINGIKTNSTMTARDCYELGKELVESAHIKYASVWLMEALKMVDSSDKKLKIEILEELAQCRYQENKIREALNVMLEILQIDPLNEDALKNKSILRKKLSKNLKNEVEILEDIKQEEIRLQKKKENLKLSHPLVYKQPEKNVYGKLCRNELKPTPRQLAPLRCRYVTNKSAFLKIGPLKLEEASLDPYIVVYHDALYDTEMETIKRLAKPRFERAAVDSSDSKKLFAKYRISKAAWLLDSEHKHLPVVSQRIKDMTGLSLVNAEQLQVVNYGIGGHYEPHFDFALSDDFTYEELGIGNRIATVLFYMSDVSLGGATVFPRINTTVWPMKGTAVFWHNVFKTGKGDVRTKHAACPVLLGNKWVSNRWLHATGQEFYRPCELEPDHADDIYY